MRAVAGGERLFLDLKFHDIPNTVAGAVRSATRLRPFCLTLHASGGRAWMRAAVEAARAAAGDAEVARPKVLAVTVLTSLDEADLEAVGQPGPLTEQVRRLAALARAAAGWARPRPRLASGGFPRAGTRGGNGRSRASTGTPPASSTRPSSPISTATDETSSTSPPTSKARCVATSGCPVARARIAP